MADVFLWIFVTSAIFGAIYTLFKVVITTQKMKFSIKDYISKCDQIHSFLRIWSHLLKKFLMENFIFSAVYRILWLYFIQSCEIFSKIFNGPQNLFIFPTFVYKNIKHKTHSLLNISYLSSALDDICENMDFLWPILSRIRTESKILSLFGKTGFR